MIAVWESDEQEVIASHFQDRVRAVSAAAVGLSQPPLGGDGVQTGTGTAAVVDGEGGDGWMEEGQADDGKGPPPPEEEEGKKNKKKSKKNKKNKKDKKDGPIEVEADMQTDES